MPESKLKVGDAAHDLVEGGTVLVVERVADRVDEYSEREGYDLAGYKAHPLLEVQPDEPVFKAVYLPSTPTTNFSGTYDFPASRLARIPVEEANEALVHPNRRLVVDLLEGLLQTAQQNDMASTAAEIVDVATHSGIPTEIVDEASELAEAAQFEGGDRA